MQLSANVIRTYTLRITYLIGQKMSDKSDAIFQRWRKFYPTKFCPKIKFYVLASFARFNTLQMWNIRIGLLKKQSLGASKRIFNFIVNRLSIINSLSNPHGRNRNLLWSSLFLFSSAHKDQQSKMHVMAWDLTIFK